MEMRRRMKFVRLCMFDWNKTVHEVFPYYPYSTGGTNEHRFSRVCGSVPIQTTVQGSINIAFLRAFFSNNSYILNKFINQGIVDKETYIEERDCIYLHSNSVDYYYQTMACVLTLLNKLIESKHLTVHSLETMCVIQVEGFGRAHLIDLVQFACY